jgi:putative AbiEi antitoxin of type IV toxin-antitoxin system
VDGHRVLPVLDGFDELAPDLRAAALPALNDSALPLPMTSRPDEYRDAVAVSDVLTGAACVELNDLTLGDLTEYLPRTSRKISSRGRMTTVWEPVLASLRDPIAADLRAVLATPLMVSLARAIYSDTPDPEHAPTELLDSTRFGNPEELEDHLLQRYVATAYRSPITATSATASRRRHRWSQDRTQRWLVHLAQHVNRLGTRDLAWWRLGATVTSRWSLTFPFVIAMAADVQHAPTLGFALLTVGMALVLWGRETEPSRFRLHLGRRGRLLAAQAALIGCVGAAFGVALGITFEVRATGQATAFAVELGLALGLALATLSTRLSVSAPGHSGDMTLRTAMSRHVHAVASRQDGVVTTAQLHEAGVGRCTMNRIVRSGTWTRLAKGVFWVGQHPRGPSLRAHVRGVLLTSGPHLVAAGPTAARLLGIQGLPRDGTLHFCAPPGHEIRSRSGLRVRRTAVPPEARMILRGIPLTAPTRTCADLLLQLPRLEAVSTLDSALHQGLLTNAERLAVLSHLSGRRGAPRARDWLRLADRRAESPLETRIRLICLDGGLPPPQLQWPVWDSDHACGYRLDLAWPAHLVAIEADGRGPHATPQALYRDRHRQNRLATLLPGLSLFRFTWNDTHTPQRSILTPLRQALRLP